MAEACRAKPSMRETEWEVKNVSDERRTAPDRGAVARSRNSAEERGRETGTASGTTAPTPGRPYRAFHFSRVVPVPPRRIPRSFWRVNMSNE